MELEEAIKVLKHWSTTISACDIDSNNRIAQALERILHYIKEESIPKAVVEEKIEEYKKILLNLNKFSDVDRIKAINERKLELEEILNKGEKDGEDL